MKILVLCGGISTEKEVSVNSSENVAAALKKRGHSVILLDVFFGSVEKLSFDNDYDLSVAAEKIRERQKSASPEEIKNRQFFGKNVLNVAKEADIVFLGLHGEDGENGKIQAAFDLLKIKYTGSDYLGSAIAMSKAYTKRFLEGFIPMAKGDIIHRNEEIKPPKYMPCVVKPSNGGSSVGVYIVKTEDEFYDAVNEALKLDDTVLIEQFIEGRELTQGVLDGTALPPIEIIPKQGFYDYKNKYVAGLTDEICPADITKEELKRMSEYSVLAGRVLGLSVYFRLDYRMDSSGKIYILEANSLPGMTATSLVPLEAKTIGMDFGELCERIIEISLKKYE